MEYPLSGRRRLHLRKSSISRRMFVSKQLEPAIRGKSCPICLTYMVDRRAAVVAACLHAYCVDCLQKWSDLKRKCPLCNADYDSWFFRIDLSSRTFLEQRLPALHRRESNTRTSHNRLGRRLDVQRVLMRSKEELSHVNQCTRPLPRRRWFEKPAPESSDAVVQRVLHWRSSIYEQRLQAVPHFSWSKFKLKTAENTGAKQRILQRIEPWIRRELQAILKDPDPTVIVHVASSLFISSFDVPAVQSVPEDNHLEPLLPFLHGLTHMFWHELRCFAGSPFNMETYDAVAEYERMIA